MSTVSSAVGAVALVKTFLRLVENRRLDEASAHLAKEAEIVFPGNRRFSNLHDQVASSRTRFTSVRKEFKRVDVLDSEDGMVVYVIGELSGVDVHGQRFSGVRFIDRFTIVDGLIAEQAVWNDVAEVGRGDL